MKKKKKNALGQNKTTLRSIGESGTASGFFFLLGFCFATKREGEDVADAPSWGVKEEKKSDAGTFG